jgi:prepilin signal peptidase PulO-like enzyme (type II secretory pathway)
MLACLLIVLVLGALVGGQVNRAIYGLAWNRRTISPWSTAVGGQGTRRWSDRIPVVGWWFLRRESGEHGAGFWCRPMLIELLLAVGLAALYWLERHQGLLPPGAVPQQLATMHLQFGSHAVLICLMTVASFIDLDEKTIPDEVTLPGTLIGLTLAGLFPQSLLPAWKSWQPPIQIEPLWLTSPFAWQGELDGMRGLLIGIACVVGWWYALLPKTLWYRSGPRCFARYLLASMARHPHSSQITVLAGIVVAAVTLRWWIGGPGWQGLLTALVALAAAGALVWTVRIIAGVALQQEAMGFGDVTLMGMIGTFIGWQPAIIAFFLAPFAGVGIALLQWLLTGRKDIAYGPFLCLSSLLVIVFWPVMWNRWAFLMLSLGAFLPAVLAICLVLLALLLLLLQWLKAAWSLIRPDRGLD